MPAQISNLRSLRRLGVFADRDSTLPSLDFKQFNLIYGFNGSGKSTLSRIFASLKMGKHHPRLPDESSFEVELSDGVTHRSDGSLHGLESRVMVFNGDYIDENLQWSEGRASPVFFIGANQAEAATDLAKVEQALAKQTKLLSDTVGAGESAGKAMAVFKREREQERLRVASIWWEGSMKHPR